MGFKVNNCYSIIYDSYLFEKQQVNFLFLAYAHILLEDSNILLFDKTNKVK